MNIIIDVSVEDRVPDDHGAREVADIGRMMETVVG